MGWLYAVGEVNHHALLTHQGKYQARIAGAAIAGPRRWTAPGHLRKLGVRRRHWTQSASRPVSGWQSLTDIERAASELVAQGLKDQQVADQMYISVHTMAFHMRQVFRKLGIGSRVELARIVLQQAHQPHHG
jgi:DNA-binding CsgD family transcriptional regulator